MGVWSCRVTGRKTRHKQRNQPLQDILLRFMATTPAQSLPKGIQKLVTLLEHLNKPPKLTFATNVKGLRLTLAYKNDHWGARYVALCFLFTLNVVSFVDGWRGRIRPFDEDEARLHLLKEKPRHFIQESLPRIRYANPDLDIEVVKWRKEKNDHWRPELALTFGSFFFFFLITFPYC